MKVISTLALVLLIFLGSLGTVTPYAASASLTSADPKMAQAQGACQATLDINLQTLIDECSSVDSNMVCYGAGRVELKLAENADATASFSAVGDKYPLNTVKSITVSDLDQNAGTVGLALLRVTQGQSKMPFKEWISFLVFDGTTFEINYDAGKDYFNFTLHSENSGACIPDFQGGVAVHSSRLHDFTFGVDGMQITLSNGATALLRAVTRQTLKIDLTDGEARVAFIPTMGSSVTRDLLHAQTVSVKLGTANGLSPIGPPAMPDGSALDNLSLRLLDSFAAVTQKQSDLKVQGCVEKVTADLIYIGDQKVIYDPKYSDLERAKPGDCLGIDGHLNIAGDGTAVLVPLHVTRVAGPAATPYKPPTHGGMGR